jgi:hypothetical protein
MRPFLAKLWASFLKVVTCDVGDYSLVSAHLAALRYRTLQQSTVVQGVALHALARYLARTSPLAERHKLGSKQPVPVSHACLHSRAPECNSPKWKDVQFSTVIQVHTSAWLSQNRANSSNHRVVKPFKNTSAPPSISDPTTVYADLSESRRTFDS